MTERLIQSRPFLTRQSTKAGPSERDNSEMAFQLMSQKPGAIGFSLMSAGFDTAYVARWVDELGLTESWDRATTG
jgi:hypothetical protein